MINASVAIGMVEGLRQSGYVIDEKSIREGIKSAVWPGRFEIIRHDPLVILDGAHNPGSCRVLVKTLKDIFPKKNITLVLGVSADKDQKGICHELDKVACRIIFTKAKSPRAFDFGDFKQNGLFQDKEVVYTSSVREAIHRALKTAKKNGTILVAGSLYLVGEARKLCTSRN